MSKIRLTCHCADTPLPDELHTLRFLEAHAFVFRNDANRACQRKATKTSYCQPENVIEVSENNSVGTMALHVLNVL